MTSNEAEFTVEAPDGEAWQIPNSIQATPMAGPVSARDRLLETIVREAQQVADKHAGEAATALEALARAFALVASPTGQPSPVVPTIGRRDIPAPDYN
ncbi:hypothetical protein ACFV6D_29890 [Kitasatospora sp. NPDC059812]|uniref:hypothetical protein n=1 Tax=Kitasatospora sp. NPDC059812 TaxID=3346958 RepID=UPI0036660D4D